MEYFLFHRYTHAEKIWNFLRYDRSNKFVTENELHSKSSFGPISLFKWPDPKVDLSEETKLLSGNVKEFLLHIYICLLIFYFRKRINWIIPMII